ncbi:uncharacterized protein LOC118797905 [Colossoma macropomum]|uniref:uncharacterized protein LOC118797905 n=1 Tax=Colossoma macropomum TaxID=42526 RepID=UPI001864A8FF|nr:uncharacterized protein LOC118797905 [Colossoma macropomum]
MVLSGTLRVVLLCLLSLCLRGTEVKRVNQNNLALIIRYIQSQYSPGDQYAVAINIPAKFCTKTFNLDDFKSVLMNDLPDNVKDVMKGPSKVYSGTQLIGATPLPDTKSPVNRKTRKHPNFHSEYLLLIKSTPLATDPNPNDPLMQKLLNRDPQGCVIFYTYNSPCIRTCLNEKNKERNILTALNMLRDHQGPKAFVYNKIFHYDQNNTDLEKNLKKIEGKDEKFLYRCSCYSKYNNNNNNHNYNDNDNSICYMCQLCFSEDEAAEQCLN